MLGRQHTCCRVIFWTFCVCDKTQVLEHVVVVSKIKKTLQVLWNWAVAGHIVCHLASVALRASERSACWDIHREVSPRHWCCHKQEYILIGKVRFPLSCLLNPTLRYIYSQLLSPRVVFVACFKHSMLFLKFRWKELDKLCWIYAHFVSAQGWTLRSLSQYTTRVVSTRNGLKTCFIS